MSYAKNDEIILHHSYVCVLCMSSKTLPVLTEVRTPAVFTHNAVLLCGMEKIIILHLIRVYLAIDHNFQARLCYCAVRN